MAASKINEGQIVENYQGRFAKVVSVKGNRYGLTAWVTKKDDAEKDEKVVRHLNPFGLSQVLGTAEVGDATFNTEGETSAKGDAAPKRKTAPKKK